MSRKTTKWPFWRVTHPELGEIKVKATSKLSAVIAAGQAWNVPWTSIARKCEFYIGRTRQ